MNEPPNRQAAGAPAAHEVGRRPEAFRLRTAARLEASASELSTPAIEAVEVGRCAREQLPAIRLSLARSTRDSPIRPRKSGFSAVRLYGTSYAEAP